MRLLWAAAIAASQAVAQEPTPRQPFKIEVGVQVVSLTVVAYDKGGHFVRGLGPKDVQVLEDGVPQEVSYFREANGGPDKIPLSVVMVLDASGSMKRNMHFLQEGADAFITKMEDVDSALVVQFNNTVKASSEFSTDTDRLEEFVDALQAWGGTSLYDAVHYGLERIKDQPGRKALVVFTDGDDTTSSMKEQEVIDYARAVEATVYGVGIPGDGPGGTPRGFLKRITSETGGEHFFPEHVADLVKVFKTISEELHNHYALAYTPKRDPDGNWRTINVQLVARKDVTLRVRKGYFAVARKPPAKPRADVAP
jgi:Ca-activated chloride channel homolog